VKLNTKKEMVLMNNDTVKELLNAVGALAEMSLNFYRAVLNAGATREEAFVLLQSFISASIHGNKEESNED
jgi:hypothetical protein